MFVTYGVIFVCIRNIAAAEHAKQIEQKLKLLTTQVQAHTQTSGTSEPYVTVRIHRKSDKLVIWVKNTCRPQLDYTDGFPSEKYGAGLLSVQQTAEAREGELSLTAKGDVFTAPAPVNLPE